MAKVKKTQKNDPEEDRIDCESMNDKEIEEWVATTGKVLVVLESENKEVYKRIYNDFILDLQQLRQVGRITDEDCKDILENI